MKTTIFSIMLFLSLSLNAQSYVLNVDELNQEQLNFALQKARSTNNLGVYIMTGGLAAMVIGATMDNEAVILVGGAAFAIGVPFYIDGTRRITQIEIALLKFEPISSLGAGLKLNFNLEKLLGMRF